MRTRFPIEKEESIEELLHTPSQKSVLRNCNLCAHQGVCSAFMLFKTNIEPALLSQNTTLKAENLAWICSMYMEEKKEE